MIYHKVKYFMIHILIIKLTLFYVYYILNGRIGKIHMTSHNSYKGNNTLVRSLEK